MEKFNHYGFFNLTMWNPTHFELLENLEYHLKVEDWKFKVSQVGSGSYFLEFPD